MKPIISTFTFDGMLSLRTVVADGEPWFVAKDVALALDYSDAEAMTRRLDDDEKQNRRGVGFGPRGVTVISESGLYGAILGSRKAEAKKFRRWVTGTVLPAIRKTGQFQADVRKLRHATASSTKVQDAMLVQVREAIGKATQAHHFSNEHRMVNSLLLGEFKGIDRDTLTPGQLDLLAHLELRNAVLIGAGMSYEQRKGALKAFALDWRMAQTPALAEHAQEA